MNKTNRRGFTLIELLVVIAIIGILASIVVVSLADQSGKADDVKIKSSLSQLTAQAIVYKNDNSGSYLDFFTANDNAVRIIESIKNVVANEATDVFTTASAGAWVVNVKLPGTDDTWWCVDDTGLVGVYDKDSATGLTGTAPTSSTVVCI